MEVGIEMKKYTFGLLMILAMNSWAFSKDFNFEKVTACGPQKINLSDINQNESHLYYFIHTSSNGDFVIVNYASHYQYKSFEETSYSNTYWLVGTKAKASLETENGILKYKLTTKTKSETQVKALMLDLNTMTYTSRIAGYNPSMGICWDVDIK